MNPRFAKEWLISLRHFSLTHTCIFLREFFPNILDLLILSDCANRYVIICLPHQKDTYVTKRAVGFYLLAIMSLSCTFSALSTKMNVDIHSYGDTGISVDIYLPWKLKKNGNYTWIPYMVLKLILAAMIGIFHIFLTYRIAAALNKAIAFLKESRASSNQAHVYRKIIRFSVINCCVSSFYNLCVNNVDVGLMIRHQVHAHFVKMYIFESTPNMVWEDVFIISRHVTNMVLCMKPVCYGIAYLWIKLL